MCAPMDACVGRPVSAIPTPGPSRISYIIFLQAPRICLALFGVIELYTEVIQRGSAALPSRTAALGSVLEPRSWR